MIAALSNLIAGRRIKTPAITSAAPRPRDPERSGLLRAISIVGAKTPKRLSRKEAQRAAKRGDYWIGFDAGRLSMLAEIGHDLRDAAGPTPNGPTIAEILEHRADASLIGCVK